jgi:hypothetical protein
LASDSRGKGAPVFNQLVVVLGSPLQHESERAPGHGSAKDSQRLDANDRLEFAVAGMEVRRFVFAPVHRDNDTEKRADRGHLGFFAYPIRTC